MFSPQVECISLTPVFTPQYCHLSTQYTGFSFTFEQTDFASIANSILRKLVVCSEASFWQQWEMRERLKQS